MFLSHCMFTSHHPYKPQFSSLWNEDINNINFMIFLKILNICAVLCNIECPPEIFALLILNHTDKTAWSRESFRHTWAWWMTEVSVSFRLLLCSDQANNNVHFLRSLISSTCQPCAELSLTVRSWADCCVWSAQAGSWGGHSITASIHLAQDQTNMHVKASTNQKCELKRAPF